MSYFQKFFELCLAGLVCLLLLGCKGEEAIPNVKGYAVEKVVETVQILPGAHQTALYFDELKGKKVGLVVNQTSMIGSVHLADSLLAAGFDVQKIFAPEHGFRGSADAGEKVENGLDPKTGLPIISLYGKNKKPSQEQLARLEVLVFDIQDAGVRFYTYISTLHYVMEAAAEAGIKVIVLDRPNPHADYIDGPVMQDEFKSFVGLHNVPVIYGLTIGEYAQMINGEQWLKNSLHADLLVVPVANFVRNAAYEFPIAPSPNLPNMRSILLYPSLCLFEGTTVSVGRGTEKQFQLYGHPDFKESSFEFTPIKRPGAKYPKHEQKVCYGVDLSERNVGRLYNENRFDLSFLLNAYQQVPQEDFFNKNNFFEKLAGNDQLRIQIKEGRSEEEIRQTWQKELEDYNKTRVKYLIYE